MSSPISSAPNLASPATRSLPRSIDVTTLAHVRNATGAANEQWVRALRPEPPEAMLLRFHDVTRRRAESLSAMSPEEFDAPTQTPVGIAPYRRFMEIRVFDCWLHEQDIRSAVGRPGHEDGPMRRGVRRRGGACPRLHRGKAGLCP